MQTAACRLDNQPGQIGQDMAAPRLGAAIPCRVIFEKQFRARQLPAQVGQERGQRRRIHKSAANGIDNVDLLLTEGLDQSGYATGC